MANFISTWRFAKIAPRKARLVADLIRGKSVDDAFDLLKFSKKRAAVMIVKVLKAAVAADAQQVNVSDLYVAESFCDAGPIVKRMMPKDRGKSYRILKRTCHITVGVAEGAEERANAAEDRKKNRRKPRVAKAKAA